MMHSQNSQRIQSESFDRRPVLERKLILSIAAIVLVIGGLFFEAIMNIVHSWSTPDANHGPLIIAVVGYLIWIKRNELKSSHIKPSIVPGALIFAFGCVLLFFGKITATIVIQKIAILPSLVGAIWLLLGYRFVIILFLPVSYLILLTGFFEHLLGDHSIYLQRVSGWIAFYIYKMIGMPATLDSTILCLPHITMEIVQACSGVNHIIALLALAVPLAVFTQTKILNRAILIFAALPVGILGNGLRIALIGIYSKYSIGSDLHGPYELLYVSFIFFFGVIVLILLSKLLKSNHTELTEKADNQEAISSGNSSKTALYLLLAISAVTLISYQMAKPKPAYLASSLQNLSFVIGDFRGRDGNVINQHIVPYSAPDEILRIYENDQGVSIRTYLGYFPLQTNEIKVTDYRRKWMHSRIDKVVDVNGFNVNKINLNSSINDNFIYFFYIINNKIVLDYYEIKIESLKSLLFNQKNNAAIIVFTTNSEEQALFPFMAEMISNIQGILHN
jgi:exosortase